MAEWSLHKSSQKPKVRRASLGKDMARNIQCAKKCSKSRDWDDEENMTVRETEQSTTDKVR